MISIKDTIDSFCSQVDWNAGVISFNHSEFISKAVSISANDVSALVIGRSFRDMIDEEQEDALKQMLCLLAARIYFKNELIKLGSSEWRYFAFKCELLEGQNKKVFGRMEVLLEDW